MSTETATEAHGNPTAAGGPAWTAGGVAGLAGGVVMGAMLTTQMGPVIEHAIPALYGLDGLAAGWGVHLVHSVVFGLLFAGLASLAPVRAWAGGVGRSAALGLGYGVAVWVVAAVLLMPVWLQAVEFANAPTAPNVVPKSAVGHVVFGVVLGGAYGVLGDR